MKKDIDLSPDYARNERIVLPIMALIGQIYQAMLNQGHGAQAYTVVSRWVKEQNSEE